MRQLLQPIAAFVGRREIERARERRPQWRKPQSQLKLFYFISWWNHAWN